MTEIPKKQENQTWAHYFIERLKEIGADANMHNFHFEETELKNPDYVCKVGHNPDVEIRIGFSWDTYSSRFPEDDLQKIPDNVQKFGDLRKVPNLEYDNDTSIRIIDSEDEHCYVHVGNDENTFYDLDAQGALEYMLSEDLSEGLSIEQIICKMADFVKQRQDFYKSEEQK